MILTWLVYGRSIRIVRQAVPWWENGPFPRKVRVFCMEWGVCTVQHVACCVPSSLVRAYCRGLISSDETFFSCHSGVQTVRGHLVIQRKKS